MVEQKSIEMIEVLDGVRFSEGLGLDSNIYVIEGEDLVLIVDTGNGLSYQRLRNLVSGYERGLVILTHYHFDHTGGAPILREEKPGFSFLMGEEDIRFSDLDFIEPLSMERIEIGSFSLEILRTPGHTPGSICLYDEDRGVLVSGDTLFPDGFGRTDLPGGDSERMLETLRRLADLDFEILLPGHGRPLLSGGRRAAERALEMAEEILFE